MPHVPRPSRRTVLLGAGAVAIGGAVAASQWFNVFARTEGALTVSEAHDMAAAGAIFLIDIRRPDEWARTGVGAPAIPIDMRRDDFEAVLTSVFDHFGARPVALICARGVRSNRMTARLRDAGFTDIIDVPEGMLGSGAGVGYLERGLPLRQPTDDELNGMVLKG